MNNKTETSDKILSQFFNGKSIGKNLKEMAVDMVKTDTQDVVSRWYHAPSTDLFTWTDRKRNIIKQQLHFNGQIVEWNCLEGVKTGLMIEAEMGLKPTYNADGRMEKEKVSETIKFDHLPMNACVDLALEILEFTLFEDDVRNQLILNFKDPQNINTMEPERFLNRFGSALDRVKASHGEPGFFNTIRDSLRRLMK